MIEFGSVSIDTPHHGRPGDSSSGLLLFWLWLLLVGGLIVVVFEVCMRRGFGKGGRFLCPYGAVLFLRVLFHGLRCDSPVATYRRPFGAFCFSVVVGWLCLWWWLVDRLVRLGWLSRGEWGRCWRFLCPFGAGLCLWVLFHGLRFASPVATYRRPFGALCCRRLVSFLALACHNWIARTYQTSCAWVCHTWYACGPSVWRVV